jgi:arsenate reductase
MIQIYHNPRCRKSREGIAYLEEQGLQFEEIRYLDKGLTIEELQTILEKLGKSSLELVRQNEAIWKSDYKMKSLSEKDILEAIVKHPQLMERPIVINGDKAIVARPSEIISNIL